jgi:hypothetical protein
MRTVTVNTPDFFIPGVFSQLHRAEQLRTRYATMSSPSLKKQAKTTKCITDPATSAKDCTTEKRGNRKLERLPLSILAV